MKKNDLTREVKNFCLLGIANVITHDTNATSLAYTVDKLVYNLWSVGLHPHGHFYFVKWILHSIEKPQINQNILKQKKID